MPALNFKKGTRMQSNENNELIHKVSKLFKRTPANEKEAVLIVNHGELAYILSALRAINMYQISCEEVLIATVKKRKAGNNSPSSQTSGKE